MDYFAGLDVSVKDTSVCIVDDTGRITREVKVASEPDALLFLWATRNGRCGFGHKHHQSSLRSSAYGKKCIRSQRCLARGECAVLCSQRAARSACSGRGMSGKERCLAHAQFPDCPCHADRGN